MEMRRQSDVGTQGYRDTKTGGHKDSEFGKQSSRQDAPSPHWRADFPINWDEDHYVSRREFTSFLAFISAALFLGSGLSGVWQWWRRRRLLQATPVRIAALNDIPVGGAKLFHYPTSHDPCLLIRVSGDRCVAYSQQCTHLLCPVVYRAEAQQLHCPCHEGLFSVKDGRVLAGPPRRPLPRVVLERRGADLWATGMKV
jgi:nitrite reductase/ring-hydroxylating ferredoxin subunit